MQPSVQRQFLRKKIRLLYSYYQPKGNKICNIRCTNCSTQVQVYQAYLGNLWNKSFNQHVSAILGSGFPYFSLTTLWGEIPTGGERSLMPPKLHLMRLRERTHLSFQRRWKRLKNGESRSSANSQDFLSNGCSFFWLEMNVVVEWFLEFEWCWAAIHLKCDGTIGTHGSWDPPPVAPFAKDTVLRPYTELDEAYTTRGWGSPLRQSCAGSSRCWWWWWWWWCWWQWMAELIHFSAVSSKRSVDRERTCFPLFSYMRHPRKTKHDTLLRHLWM